MKLRPALLALFGLLFTDSAIAFGRNDKVLLSKVHSLTLRNDQKTTGRRLAPIPQLKCVGGDAKGLYEVDVMRCTNMGSDYGDEDMSWSCTADVPSYFKLGSTDVLCEGYNSAEDPYVLKGSCGVEYRLWLTDAGYEKYGNSFSRLSAQAGENGIWGLFFSIIFFSFLGIIIWGAWKNSATAPRPTTQRRPASNNGRPWFGGGGGDDPPPPYDPRPPGYYSKSTSTTTSGEGWRPGFWTGAAAGATGAYLAGMGRNRDREAERYVYGSGRPVRGFGGGGSSFAESSSAGATRRETTGFGQTRRR
ncbi:hypothetical protein FN846DRAFT_464038 [Sphaerosporella brunnea]|uniref:Store-operated calcium entry-associated regulatory factor n=1 Tax=Sphaerosporella brunnea TaxID=1250544 RepID=A0A5J5F4C4_9PEZI|nr:hypothetical protein FN846DRAFT_464038 [Sphaerosporella brunnea]